MIGVNSTNDLHEMGLLIPQFQVYFSSTKILVFMIITMLRHDGCDIHFRHAKYEVIGHKEKEEKREKPRKA